LADECIVMAAAATFAEATAAERAHSCLPEPCGRREAAIHFYARCLVFMIGRFEPGHDALGSNSIGHARGAA